MIDKDNLNDIEELNKQKSINIINKLNDSEDLIINKNKNKNSNNNNNSNNILLNSLFKLIEENNINELESNLIKDDSVINTLGNNGLSLLHFSVIKGNLPIINTLLKYGANPNILSDPNQQTSLHLAYLSQGPNRENIINVLLNYKANDNIIDIYNNRPSDYNKNSNSNINVNNLNTPDKKNKIKKEDIYYKINDININFFNTSDVKRKSSNKKNKKDKIKCNCIFTPKKNQKSDDVVESQKIENDYNLSDFKNININFNDNFNFNEKDNNENDISDNYSNNKLQIENKEINIYQLNNNNSNNSNIDSNDINEKVCIEKNNTVFYNKEKDNYETNNLNINDINNKVNNENNFENDDKLNDSLEEEDKVNNNNFKDILKSFENINSNMDELFKTIIENKRKSIAERSSHKKRKMSNYSNFSSFPKANIFFNYSNNSCSTQNQTSQKKMSNITKEKSKTTSEFKCNYKNIKRNEDNYNNNNIINSENNNINDNIIQKIIDNRNKFKNWLLDINLPYYYENFIENNIYGIEQLVNLYNSKEPNELFRILISILKTKKYGHIYKIISKIEMDINIIDSKLIDFMISNTDEKSRDMKLSISGGRSVICGKKNEEQNLLKLFLNKYNLSKFYQNFCHNGFDEIEYVIIQMYGKASINDFVLENYFHIYDKEERKDVLDALIKEVENINKFINSEKYLNKVGIKYENIMYENKGGIHFIIDSKNNKCNLCLIY